MGFVAVFVCCLCSHNLVCGGRLGRPVEVAVNLSLRKLADQRCRLPSAEVVWESLPFDEVFGVLVTLLCADDALNLHVLIQRVEIGLPVEIPLLLVLKRGVWVGNVEFEGDDLAIVVLHATDTLAVFERIPWFPRRMIVCLALPFDL
jgi:hypothetical protein